MRKHLPSTDLLNLGIEPTAKPTTRPDYKEGMVSKRINYSLFPTTLDELREQCGQYGDAAVANLQWGAVTIWVMNGPADGLLTHSIGLALKAVSLYRFHERYRLGFPDYRGWELSPVLDDLDPQYRRVIEQVAKDTMADWVEAGSLHLTRLRIKTAYQYINACVAREVALLLTKETMA